MGCPLSHDQPPSSPSDIISSKATVLSNFLCTNRMTATDAEVGEEAVDFKARLERKMMWSRETPDEIFDLAGCNLKEVPNGVFVLCNVLRKRELFLNANRLQSLKGGGMLQDLHLLTTLNIADNQLKRLPDDIGRLENLRELFVANNQLGVLPPAINKLKKLVLLDISGNRLSSIQEIVVMPSLKVLNVKGNAALHVLHGGLATCQDLMDIIFDVQNITEPPPEICRGGTANILKYLSTGEVVLFQEEAVDVATDNALKVQSTLDDAHTRFMALKNEKASKERAFLEKERAQMERNNELEVKFHEEQMRRRRELIQTMQNEQNETENKVLQLQSLKESERNRLIEDIVKAEEQSKQVLQNLLCLKNGPDPILLEREREEQELLLEKLMIQQSALRKQEIIDQMTSLLDQEMATITKFQDQREATSKTILEQEQMSSLMLNNVYQKYDQNRGSILDEVALNEEVQKSAVATLITKNDSRSWGLMEQIRILESELGKLTQLEIDKKKLHIDEHINDLANRRIEITYVLLDLMDQRDQRKRELIDTLNQMEAQRENRPDFWLLQYQKLMDQQPAELSLQTSAIDPLLGFQFLTHGVVHCLPFLSKIWQDSQTELQDISNDQLKAAGVQNDADRYNILRSIEVYLQSIRGEDAITSNQNDETVAATAPIDDMEQESLVTGQILSSECVICMDAEVKVLFFPCGHLCCCINCQTSLDECPMCRGSIERRIKIIQA
ncbi:E3 ubiquitin-protein ligase LRSAM1-like [Culicoides brevitarsis]|uniref:E3 ubiquitin-protein ligase LRSAM1-like n=1 Tax=Culicoides brevitarsis TaxID=469753 RepID=UPI00307BC173